MAKESLISILKADLDKSDMNLYTRIMNTYYNENYSRLRWSSLIVFVCQIIFIIRDSLAGFYLKNDLNYINLGIAIFMGLFSLAFFIYSSLNHKEWDRTPHMRIMYKVYMAFVALTVCGYSFTDMYVSGMAFGVCMCFLFIPITSPFFDIVNQTVLFIFIILSLSIIYLVCFPTDPSGVIGVMILPGLLYITSCFFRSYYIKILVYREKTKLLTEELIYRNKTDFLTDVSNRFCLYDDYQEAIKTGQSIGVAIYDIDDFKKYNDTYTHLEGDKCLKMTSKAVKDFVEKHSGKIYRYGGEEFVIMFFDVDEVQFKEYIATIKNLIVDLDIKHAPNTLFPYVTISIGGTYLQKPTDSIEKMLLTCDVALYEAKGNGKNRFIIK